MMRITIIPLGSRGDVQPFVALGGILAGAGHRVRVAADMEFRPLVEHAALEYAPLSGDIRKLLAGEREELTRRGTNPIALARAMLRIVRAQTPKWAAEGLAASQDADVIVPAGAAVYLGASIAEKLRRPFVSAFVAPMAPTGEFPAVMMPPPRVRLPGFVNRWIHRMVGWMFWQALRPGVNEARKSILGLAPWSVNGPYAQFRREGRPAIYGFSEHVVRRPADWHEAQRVAGYWYLNEGRDYRGSPSLVEFLAAGEKPIYVGFGSMSDEHAEATMRVVLEAVKRAGRRAVLASGWAGPSLRAEREARPREAVGLGGMKLPEDVFLVESVPHDWLFPKVALAVHHGGAGTSAEAARWGLPQVIVPFLGDQPFWGARFEKLGAAVAPIPRRRLTVDKLSQAILRAGTDVAMQQAAKSLGERVRAERSAERTVEAFERSLGGVV